MDGVMPALATKKTQWNDDLYFAVKFARQKLSKYYSEVTPTNGLLHISAHIVDPFRTLRLFRMWDKGMEINPDDKISYATQYQQAFLKYVENKYCAKHQPLSVNKPERVASNNLFSSIGSGSGQCSFDQYDLSSDDDE